MSPTAFSLDSSSTAAEPVAGREASDASSGLRPGAIVLTRHGEPALSRKCLLTSAEYGRWWAQYEVGGLLAGQTPPSGLVEIARTAGTVVASTRRRALESAAAVLTDREPDVDVLFIEAPLPPPPLPQWLKLSPRLWGVVSRFWWHVFNHHGGQETRAEAEARSTVAAERLIAAASGGSDVVVFSHGYFNHMIGARLKASGWRLVDDQGFNYWSQRRYERS